MWVSVSASAAPASPMCHIAPVDALAAGPGGRPRPARSGRPFCAHPRRCGGRSRGIALRAEKRGKAPACGWGWKDAVSATRRFESSRPSHPIIYLFESLGATSEFWLSVRRGTGELLACRFLRIGAMNHHVFAVVVARQQLENTLKHPAFRPKIE